jgi:hypothetical protein
MYYLVLCSMYMLSSSSDRALSEILLATGLSRQLNISRRLIS